MITDLRFALRMLRTHRWFSAAVILTLALGIGVNTTVFTVVNAGLFKPVPVPGGAQLVTVVNYRTTRPDNRSGMSYPAFHEYQAQNRVFDNLEATASTVAILSDTDVPPVRYSGLRVTSGLFAMLRMPPVLGRGFMPADDQPGAAPVALIASSVWQTRYGGARDVIGRSVRINGMPTTIVGVMPDGFRFPTNQDVWVPLVPNNDLQQRAKHNLTLFGRLKPDASVETANQDLAVIGGRLASEFPATDKELLPLVRTFHQTYNGGPIRSVFLVMLAAVGFVLLIACANVANMMLSRAIERGRELSVRAAMGASRWQLVRQLLVESVLLSCLGGLLGLGLAVLGVHAFDLSVRDVGKPYWVIFSFDWRVFAYFAAISVASGLLFGLAPALRASRVDLNTALKEGTPGGGGSRNGRLASVLVVLQFALTLVLLAGAGMMVRSFFAMQALNPFVPSEQLFTARLQLPEATGERYADGATRVRLLTNMLPKLQALPGVTHAAAASF